MSLSKIKKLVGSSSSMKHPVQSHEVSSKDFQNWQLPKISESQIYEKSPWNFMSSHGIRIEEFTTSVASKDMSLQLLDSRSIQNYVSQGHRYIHFGCVQIAIKPMVRLGLDCPIMLALRDKSLKTFKDSLLALANTNICQGPIYFNCFPNLSKDLEDPFILQSLILDVNMAHNIQFEGARNFSIIYRIYYKLLNSQLNPKCRIRFAPGETLMFKVELGQATTHVPKSLKWDEVTIPDEWVVDSQPILKPIEEKKVEQIIEEPDGRVLIRFNSSRDFPAASTYEFQSARSSCSFPSFKEDNIPSTSSYKVFQKTPIPEIITENVSPTHSEMRPPSFSSINVLFREFKIDKAYLQEDFSSEENYEKRKWFYENFDKEARDFLREEWYSFMNKLSANVLYFTWLPIYFCQNDLMYPFNSIQTHESLSQKWTLKDGKIVQAKYPPLEGFLITQQGQTCHAAPFKTGREGSGQENSCLEDIKKVYEQNNFSNKILHTISKQVDNMSEQISKFKEEDQLSQDFKKLSISENSSNSNDKASTSKSYPNEITKPFLIKVPDFEPSNSSSLIFSSKPSSNLLKEISKRLDKNINCIDQDCDCSDEDYPKEEYFNEESDEHFSINKIKSKLPSSWKNNPTRNYYPRPTPPDLQYEERSQYGPQKQFSADHLYEWNIDGRSEHEIVKTLEEMMMVAEVYHRSNDNVSMNEAAAAIARGFTGNLKHWWENVISLRDKIDILNAVEEKSEEKIDPTTGEVKKEIKRTDRGLRMLMSAIVMHFMGNASDHLKTGHIILSNLRCPSLSDYRWYKDVFLSNVLTREDCTLPFWKEKFISGLPTLFAQRIFNKLREATGQDEIPYNEFTYGQLFAFIKREGLSLCNELRIQTKYGNEKAIKRKELGSFCEAFGLEKIQAPSTRKRQEKFKRSKFVNKPKSKIPKSSEKYYKKGKRVKSKKHVDDTTIICYKCGKPGHKANKCNFKKKINEIFSDNPDLQNKLLNLFQLSQNSSSESEDNEINQLCYDSDNSTSSDNSSVQFCTQNICVLSNSDKEKELILDIVDKINDPLIKEQYLKRLRDIVLKKPILSNNRTEEENLNQILKMASKSPITPITTKELQTEINHIKSQIKQIQDSILDLHTKDLSIEAKLSLLENNNCPKQKSKEIIIEHQASSSDFTNDQFCQVIERISFQKWYCLITLSVSNDFQRNIIALVDSGADQNCLREGLIPSKFYEKTSEQLQSANGAKLQIKYKLPKAYVCNSGYCFKNSFILVKDISNEMILGTPFLTQIYPFHVNSEGIHTNVLGKEMTFKFVTSVSQKDIHLLQSRDRKSVV